MILDDYLRFKKQLEAKRKQLHQSEGARKQLLGQLKEEFGVGITEEAERTLEQWRQELAEVEKQLTTELAEFGQEYGKRLEEG